jgi:hypothetical protein
LLRLRFLLPLALPLLRRRRRCSASRTSRSEDNGKRTMADGLRSLQRTIEAYRRGNYSLEYDDRNESEVMGYIHGYYKEAFDRLPCPLDPLILETGFCFGFFDPVSNIIVNTAAYRGP